MRRVVVGGDALRSLLKFLVSFFASFRESILSESEMVDQ